MILPEVPYLMRNLPRDDRGYPIPFIVLRDTTGKAHFTVNDEAKRLLCFKHDLCGICGQKLQRGRWFVGGPLSAFDPHGFYVDPPMHAGCARFALQVCPYLASDHWGRSIAGKSYTPEEQQKMGTMLVDYTMLPERPPIFIAAMATAQRLQRNGLQTYVFPVKPYRNVEFWRGGHPVDPIEGRAEVVRHIQDYAKKHGRVISESDILPGLRASTNEHANARGNLRLVRRLYPEAPAQNPRDHTGS